MITILEVEKLATLSRLSLTEEEKIKFQKEIDSILSYVDQIKELSNDEEEKGRKFDEVKNVFRLDSDPHSQGIYTEAILKNAPGKEGEYLKVKKIL